MCVVSAFSIETGASPGRELPRCSHQISGKIKLPKSLIAEKMSAIGVFSRRLFSSQATRPQQVAALGNGKPYRRTAPRKKWNPRRPYAVPERPQSFLPSVSDVNKRRVKSISGSPTQLKRGIQELEKNRPFTIPKGEFRPKQSLGQNFLSDQNYVNKIVDAFSCTSKVFFPSIQLERLADVFVMAHHRTAVGLWSWARARGRSRGCFSRNTPAW